ncbi:MAG TPA: hypothetical protein PKK00_12425 [Bacteroidales bacterium]|nr:hypothetical protein [Bacteroidales bacterium]HPS18034.1 hypothetical protein [Bacteroidales bacterium]
MKNFESLKSKKFKKLSKNELISLTGGDDSTEKKANTSTPNNGHVIGDYKADDGTIYYHHFLGIWW